MNKVEQERPEFISEAVWQATPTEAREVIHSLNKRVTELTTTVEKLTTIVEQLQARLNQNSNNSSRPPSSDSPFKSKKKAKPRGGDPGGQFGHEGHHRALLDVNLVDELISVRPKSCRHCAKPLSKKLPIMAEVVRHQIQEIPEIKPRVTEYQLNALTCPACHKTTRASLPIGVSESGYGARATAIVANLHGQLHLSMSQTEQAMQDLFALPISTGSVSAICQRVSEILNDTYDCVAEKIKQEPILNMDETSWSEVNKRCYLWTAVAPGETLFKIAPTRKKEVVPQMIGENYPGIVGSDRYGGYNQIPTQRRQLCWAHLIRNLDGAIDRGGPGKEWAKSALLMTKEIFEVWHEFKADRLLFAEKIAPVKERFNTHLKLSNRITRGPTKSLATNLLKLQTALWTFAYVEGVEPTNNAAEQALRTGVIWRKTSYGTQSVFGSRFVERILTVSATCRKQDKHLLSFLTEAIRASWAGLPSPSLFNA